MRLFYAGDIHGSERCFRKFLNAAKFYDVEVLILGGDITGKVLTPVIEQKPGRFVASFLGRTEKAKGPDGLEDLESRIRFNGFYPYRCPVEEFERLQDDPRYRDEVMTRVLRDEIENWMRIADEKLSGSGVRCLIMPGNDDETEIDPLLSSETVENPDGRVIQIDGYQLLSSCWANRTPWDSPREADEDHLAEIFGDIADALDPDAPAIFNLHAPPYDSGLDVAPQLDADLRVATSGGQANMIAVGSRTVRELIESHQPVLGLHGHIHESRNAVKIGRTLCINPGSNYADGVLDGAVVELNGDAVSQYQLVSG